MWNTLQNPSKRNPVHLEFSVTLPETSHLFGFQTPAISELSWISPNMLPGDFHGKCSKSPFSNHAHKKNAFLPQQKYHNSPFSQHDSYVLKILILYLPGDSINIYDWTIWCMIFNQSASQAIIDPETSQFSQFYPISIECSPIIPC